MCTSNYPANKTIHKKMVQLSSILRHVLTYLQQSITLKPKNHKKYFKTIVFPPLLFLIGWKTGDTGDDGTSTPHY